ncbi:hypothetical protein [Saccharothrix syringae]|uniref:Uncharacterized protein n=1 Tax=Saccharothrix syringae TaxID=103733 RepID=A0A5Q0GXJ5_SACSY|nr:hypothetical protein [Saccharothrix syringae]QFZ18603.1 hypothetical protein EKG83_15050 [Saccharothrix syringae]
MAAHTGFDLGDQDERIGGAEVPLTAADVRAEAAHARRWRADYHPAEDLRAVEEAAWRLVAPVLDAHGPLADDLHRDVVDIAATWLVGVVPTATSTAVLRRVAAGLRAPLERARLTATPGAHEAWPVPDRFAARSPLPGTEQVVRGAVAGTRGGDHPPQWTAEGLRAAAEVAWRTAAASPGWDIAVSAVDLGGRVPLDAVEHLAAVAAAEVVGQVRERRCANGPAVLVRGIAVELGIAAPLSRWTATPPRGTWCGNWGAAPPRSPHPRSAGTTGSPPPQWTT